MKRTKFEEKPRRIAVSSAKAKGRDLQKWVCEKISEITGFPWGKDQPIESRGMGQTGVDVRMESQVRKLFPFSVECKRQESWSVPNWIRQAKDNTIPNTDWLLIMRSNRQSAVVVMDAERFFQTYKQLIDNTNNRKGDPT